MPFPDLAVPYLPTPMPDTGGAGTATTGEYPPRRDFSRGEMVHAVRVVFNQAAGSVVRQGNQSLADTLANAFRDIGVVATFDVIDGHSLEDGAVRAFDMAQRGSVDAIVVGGGDGTVRAVAGVAAGSDVPVGILPLGTFNHFARDVGVPLDLRQAVAAIAAGRSRRVDLGEVNGRIFINNSSIGIYPYMVLDRERRRSRDGRWKWTAMVFALFRGLRRFPRRRLIVRAEGLVAGYRTPCLFVGNNEYDLNFLSLGRRQELDAGRLHLYVARPVTKLGFLWFLVRAALGLADRVNDLDEIRAVTAEISARSSRLPVALDGDVEMLSTPLRYRARPRGLRVIVPAEGV
jgi:diacylglycerol kinase family enzyme